MSLIPISKLIFRLITRGEQALFNLEIKKNSETRINPDIHHSKVPSSVQTFAIQCVYKVNTAKKCHRHNNEYTTFNSTLK